MEKKVLLLGANNPETARTIHRIGESKNIEIAGYIDNDPAKKNTSFYGLPVFGGFEVLPDFDPEEYCFVNLISGSAVVRYKTSQVLKNAGFSFTNLIHPKIDLYMVKTGQGIYLQEGVIVQAEVELADHSCIHIGSLVGHESKLGEGSFIAHGVAVSGCVNIGKGVFVGAGSVILPRVNIGDWAVIGGGAVVTKDVPAGAVMVGNPAKLLKMQDIPE